MRVKISVFVLLAILSLVTVSAQDPVPGPVPFDGDHRWAYMEGPSVDYDMGTQYPRILEGTLREDLNSNCIYNGSEYRTGSMVDVGEPLAGVNMEASGWHADHEICLGIQTDTIDGGGKQSDTYYGTDWGGEWFNLDDWRVTEHIHEGNEPEISEWEEWWVEMPDTDAHPSTGAIHTGNPDYSVLTEDAGFAMEDNCHPNTGGCDDLSDLANSQKGITEPGFSGTYWAPFIATERTINYRYNPHRDDRENLPADQTIDAFHLRMTVDGDVGPATVSEQYCNPQYLQTDITSELDWRHNSCIDPENNEWGLAPETNYGITWNGTPREPFRCYGEERIQGEDLTKMEREMANSFVDGSRDVVSDGEAGGHLDGNWVDPDDTILSAEDGLLTCDLTGKDWGYGFNTGEGSTLNCIQGDCREPEYTPETPHVVTGEIPFENAVGSDDYDPDLPPQWKDACGDDPNEYLIREHNHGDGESSDDVLLQEDDIYACVTAPDRCVYKGEIYLPGERVDVSPDEQGAHSPDYEICINADLDIPGGEWVDPDNNKVNEYLIGEEGEPLNPSSYNHTVTLPGENQMGEAIWHTTQNNPEAARTYRSPYAYNETEAGYAWEINCHEDLAGHLSGCDTSKGNEELIQGESFYTFFQHGRTLDDYRDEADPAGRWDTQEPHQNYHDPIEAYSIRRFVSGSPEDGASNPQMYQNTEGVIFDSSNNFPTSNLNNSRIDHYEDNWAAAPNTSIGVGPTGEMYLPGQCYGMNPYEEDDKEWVYKNETVMANSFLTVNESEDYPQGFGDWIDPDLTEATVREGGFTCDLNTTDWGIGYDAGEGAELECLEGDCLEEEYDPENPHAIVGDIAFAIEEAGGTTFNYHMRNVEPERQHTHETDLEDGEVDQQTLAAARRTVFSIETSTEWNEGDFTNTEEDDANLILEPTTIENENTEPEITTTRGDFYDGAVTGDLRGSGSSDFFVDDEGYWFEEGYYYEFDDESGIRDVSAGWDHAFTVYSDRAQYHHRDEPDWKWDNSWGVRWNADFDGDDARVVDIDESNSEVMIGTDNGELFYFEYDDNSVSPITSETNHWSVINDLSLDEGYVASTSSETNYNLIVTEAGASIWDDDDEDQVVITRFNDHEAVDLDMSQNMFAAYDIENNRINVYSIATSTNDYSRIAQFDHSSTVIELEINGNELYAADSSGYVTKYDIDREEKEWDIEVHSSTITSLNYNSGTIYTSSTSSSQTIREVEETTVTEEEDGFEEQGYYDSEILENEDDLWIESQVTAEIEDWQSAQIEYRFIESGSVQHTITEELESGTQTIELEDRTEEEIQVNIALEGDEETTPEVSNVEFTTGQEDKLPVVFFMDDPDEWDQEDKWYEIEVDSDETGELTLTYANDEDINDIEGQETYNVEEGNNVFDLLNSDYSEIKYIEVDGDFSSSANLDMYVRSLDQPDYPFYYDKGSDESWYNMEVDSDGSNTLTLEFSDDQDFETVEGSESYSVSSGTQTFDLESSSYSDYRYVRLTASETDDDPINSITLYSETSTEMPVEYDKEDDDNWYKVEVESESSAQLEIEYSDGSDFSNILGVQNYQIESGFNEFHLNDTPESDIRYARIDATYSGSNPLTYVTMISSQTSDGEIGDGPLDIDADAQYPNVCGDDQDEYLLREYEPRAGPDAFEYNHDLDTVVNEDPQRENIYGCGTTPHQCVYNGTIYGEGMLVDISSEAVDGEDIERGVNINDPEICLDLDETTPGGSFYDIDNSWMNREGIQEVAYDWERTWSNVREHAHPDYFDRNPNGTMWKNRTHLLEEDEMDQMTPDGWNESEIESYKPIGYATEDICGPYLREDQPGVGVCDDTGPVADYSSDPWFNAGNFSFMPGVEIEGAYQDNYDETAYWPEQDETIEALGRHSRVRDDSHQFEPGSPLEQNWELMDTYGHNYSIPDVYTSTPGPNYWALVAHMNLSIGNEGSAYEPGTEMQPGCYYREGVEPREDPTESGLSKMDKAFGNSYAHTIFDDNLGLEVGIWKNPDDMPAEHAHFDCDITGPDKGYGVDAQTYTDPITDEYFEFEDDGGFTWRGGTTDSHVVVGDIAFAWTEGKNGSFVQEPPHCGDDHKEYLIEELGEAGNSLEWEGRWGCGMDTSDCVSRTTNEQNPYALYRQGDMALTETPADNFGRDTQAQAICQITPADAHGVWYSQDYAQRYCQENSLYGSLGVRWFSEEDVNEHPEAFTGGINNDMNPYLYERDGEPEYISTQGNTDYDEDTESPVPTGKDIDGDIDQYYGEFTGWTPPNGYEDMIHSQGFCGGAAAGEHLVVQDSSTALVETDFDVLGVADNPDACILDGERTEGVDHNERQLYNTGHNETIDLGEQTRTVSCFQGTWYDKWPIVFLDRQIQVPEMNTRAAPFQVVNVENTERTFEVEIDAEESLEPFTDFGEGQGASFTTTVPSQEARQFVIQIYGGDTDITWDEITVEAEAVDSDIQGQDTLEVNVVEQDEVSIEGGTVEVPGLQTIPMISIILLIYAIIARRPVERN